MSDYLWDKTGEADPEVERLENLLGAFAHRPRPLALPAPQTRARRHTFLRYAAAAAVLLAVLAGALVALRLAPRKEAGPVAGTAPGRTVDPPGSATPPVAPRRGEAVTTKGEPAPRSQKVPEVANKSQRTRRPAASQSVVRRARAADPDAAREVADAAERLRAKEQLVYALRLTGAKLEEVRRRVQGAGDAEDSPEGRGRTR